MISLSELAVKIKGESKVALFCHVRPDGDTLGSALALANAIKTLGAQAVVVCDDPIPPRFLFLEDAKTVQKSIDVKDFSALIAIDCADVSRLGCYAEDFLKHKNYELLEPIVLANRTLTSLKNIIIVTQNPGLTAEACGVSPAQYRAINYKYRSLNVNAVKQKIKFLTNIDLALKSSKLDMSKEAMMSYLVTNLCYKITN